MKYPDLLSTERSAKANGFSLIELLVVISIMGLVAGLLIANFNRQIGPRNLKIARTALTANMRKIQGNALTSRNLPSGLPAKFYMIEFEPSRLANGYRVYGVNNQYGLELLETPTFPSQVSYLSSKSVSLEQPIQNSIKPIYQYPTCTQILIGLPNGRAYMRGSSNDCSATSSVVELARNPVALYSLVDSRVMVYLRETRNNTQSTVIFDGITGTINGQ